MKITAPIDGLEKEREGRGATECNTNSNDEETDMDVLHTLNTAVQCFQIQPESNATHFKVLISG